MSRFNFTDITRESTADILTVMDNFNKVENDGAIVEDLSHVFDITLSTNSWISVTGGYEYIISNSNIKAEPYIIDVIFSDLTIIKSPIFAKPSSQADGSIVLKTSIKPTVDLVAKLIVTKGVV